MFNPRPARRIAADNTQCGVNKDKGPIVYWVWLNSKQGEKPWVVYKDNSITTISGVVFSLSPQHIHKNKKNCEKVVDIIHRL
jgi:hypothetical protein